MLECRTALTAAAAECAEKGGQLDDVLVQFQNASHSLAKCDAEKEEASRSLREWKHRYDILKSKWDLQRLASDRSRILDD